MPTFINLFRAFLIVGMGCRNCGGPIPLSVPHSHFLLSSLLSVIPSLPENQWAFREENQEAKLYYIKPYYKALIPVSVVLWEGINRSFEQKREPQKKTHIKRLNLWKRWHCRALRKNGLFTNGAETTERSYGRERNLTLYHIIYKTQCRWIVDLNMKRRTIKILDLKSESFSLWILSE